MLRRSFLAGVGAFLAAPAIIRVADLMAIKPVPSVIIPVTEMPEDLPFNVNSPLAVKLWSKKIAREALAETMASKFMPRSSSDWIGIMNANPKLFPPLRLT